MRIPFVALTYKTRLNFSAHFHAGTGTRADACERVLKSSLQCFVFFSIFFSCSSCIFFVKKAAKGFEKTEVSWNNCQASFPWLFLWCCALAIVISDVCVQVRFHGWPLRSQVQSSSNERFETGRGEVVFAKAHFTLPPSMTLLTTWPKITHHTNLRF